MKLLPTDIILKIFSYYYSPQSVELMEDIRNFIKTLDEISYIYYYFWVENLPFPIIINSTQDKDWLVRDLYNFTKNYYINWEKIEPLWFKKCLIGNKETRIDLYINNYLVKKKPTIQMRIIWGMLTAKERSMFVKNRKKLMIDNQRKFNIITPAF